MQRMGMLIGLKPGRVEEHKALHADVWPGVLSHDSIFLKEPENILFGYWEDAWSTMALVEAAYESSAGTAHPIARRPT